MFYIAHRGNLLGPNPEQENSPDYIDSAIEENFHVEIDLWSENGTLFLGHDNPTYEISWRWLRQRKYFLWVHCKNYEALSFCVKDKTLDYFFHNIDDYTITSKGYIWIYPGKPEVENGICVLPEWNSDLDNMVFDSKLVGICSDYIQKYKL